MLRPFWAHWAYMSGTDVLAKQTRQDLMCTWAYAPVFLFFILYTLIPSAYASGTEASTEHMRQELMLKKDRGWNLNILQE
jgi:hypothetical protein